MSRYDDEITEADVDGVTVAYFSRAYADERSAAAAWERAREKARPDQNASVFRVMAQDGQHQVIIVANDRRHARRMRERISWGGEACQLSDEQEKAILARFREVILSGDQNSTSRWGGVGGIGITPDGSTGPLRRPKG